MADRLTASRRLDISGMASQMSMPSANVNVCIVEPVYVVGLRHLPGGAGLIEKAMEANALPSLPGAGAFEGQDPFLLWRNPGEWMLITTSGSVAESVLTVLPAGGDALAYALDQSAGSIVFELRGPGIAAVLPRLLDASAIPQSPGRGTRARLADIAVIALRIGEERIWLLGDRANDRYMAQWIAYAIQGAESAA